MNDIDRIIDISSEDKKFKEAEKLKHKLGGLRNAGLSKDGEYSNENLIYKTLRRSGYLDKLGIAKDRAFDAQFTIEESRKIKPKKLIKEEVELKKPRSNTDGSHYKSSKRD